MAYRILLEMGSVEYGTDCHIPIPIIRMLIKNKKTTLGLLLLFTPDTVSLCKKQQAVEDVEAFLLLNLFDAMFQSAQSIFF